MTFLALINYKKLALELCKNLGELCKEDSIIANRYNDGVSNGTEYYDWCQVTDDKQLPLRKYGCLVDWTAENDKWYALLPYKNVRKYLHDRNGDILSFNTKKELQDFIDKNIDDLATMDYSCYLLYNYKATWKPIPHQNFGYTQKKPN